MNPENIQKLLEIEAFKNYIADVQKSVHALDTLQDTVDSRLSTMQPEELTIEIRARKRALILAKSILGLVDDSAENKDTIDPSEYAVE